MDQQTEGAPQYTHIFANDFSYRKHKKQKEEDIVICECKYDANNPESTCGERCLNVLTNTECTPGYCPSNSCCKNQKFQKCEYAKTKLFKTEGRGWGLLADENLKAGQFIIEYCGEVISWKEAMRRSQTYETQGLKDAYIISLNGNESIDATKKGSLARFINHSCQPNCETRKWTVLGEVRVGIFAKQYISAGTELAYDYNFEWYGGAKVRCLCGAASCPGFLGAKSRGFQEDTYLWEDDDDRYSVEKIPLYDSAEDETSSKPLKTMFIKLENESSTTMDGTKGSKQQYESIVLDVNQVDAVPMESVVVKTEVSEEVSEVMDFVKTEVCEAMDFYSQDAQQPFSQDTNVVTSRTRNYQTGSGPLSRKRARLFPNGRSKKLNPKQVDAKSIAKLLASKEAQDEIFKYEDLKNQATSKLDSLYNDIRPAILEHEGDSQDCVPISVAEKWIGPSCSKMGTDFDLYSSLIRNLVCTPRRTLPQAKPAEEGNNASELWDGVS